MKYAYYDLGDQTEGSMAVVRLHGSMANVILVDEMNFSSYRRREPFLYEGGFSRESPVELTIPADGHWYVVVDLGGFKGRVRGSVEVRPAEGAALPQH